MTLVLRLLVVFSAFLVPISPTRATEAVKIAFIDPLSGPFADTGDQALKHLQYFVDARNAQGGLDGRPMELLALDNKTSPKESLIQLEKAIDQGARFIVQGQGSAVAGAIIEAVERHNERNPASRVLFLNYAAVDPAFTNDKCSFWHFRFDADADTKMDALTDWIRSRPEIRKVYVIGQDYSFGQAVSASAKAMLKAKRPDVEIVGDELHPLGKVKDFTPYVTKMKAAGADVVITGNWGNDLGLLVKAAGDASFKVPFLTYYAGGVGAAAAIGKAGLGNVRQVSDFHMNIEGLDLAAQMDAFEKKTGYDLYFWRLEVMVQMLARAVSEAKSADPVAVASKLEGMRVPSAVGSLTMRADNHQLVSPLFISVWSDTATRKLEKSEFGFVNETTIPAEKTRRPTTCKMTRPAS